MSTREPKKHPDQAAPRRQADAQPPAFVRRVDRPADWNEIPFMQESAAALKDIIADLASLAAPGEGMQRSTRATGRGSILLFTGGTGTGKTLAARVLARELRLALYRVDVSSVVSRYIGETEKNLDRVFRSTGNAGGILLFDEADALFGKRTDVRDAHDRYANIDVSYLLERIEEHGGVVILATNRRENLDPAFIRRLRHVLPLSPDDSD